MAPRNYLLATAGHVDHGKTALVKALTGSDPDRLPEEKARGITIDLGFAHLRLVTATDPATELNLGIVDVPGHEDFIKNMVAGIGAIDAALLVIAADDLWMPQTEEHVQLLEYAGIRHGVVAITKIDRIDASARDRAVAAVRARVAGTPFAESPVIPASSKTGEGLPELRAALAACLAAAPGAPDAGKPRLWVDRAFTLRGVGTVVTGSLRGGALAAGQVVAIGPGEILARIRTLHHHNRPQPTALPGTRTALNLVAVAAGEAPTAIKRGDVVTLPECAGAHHTCDLVLRRSARAHLLAGGTRAVGHGAQCRVHVGTASIPCRLIFAQPEALLPGGECIAQLRLLRPLPIAPGEHVILRDAAERVTLAGGTVLEVGTRRKRFRHAAHQAFLAAVARAPNDCAGWVAAMLRRDGFVALSQLQVHARFAAPAVSAAASALITCGAAVARGQWLGRRDRWEALKRDAVERIARHEREHPTQNGLPLAHLQAAWVGRAPSEVIESLVAELLAADFERAGAAIRHRCFRPTLPPALRDAAEKVSAMLGRAGLNPPSRKDLARTAADAEALEFLVKTERVVVLGGDVVLLAPVYRAATRAIGAHLAARGRATVSELKQRLGVSRRVMVPLLERTDREGLTRREGEFRVLGRVTGAPRPQAGERALAL